MGLDIFYVQKNERTAARRVVPVCLVDATDYVTPWTGTLAGSPKAKLALNNGADANSTNAYTMQDNTNHPGVALLALAADEIDESGDLMITIAEGNAFGQTCVRIANADPLTGGMSDLSLHSKAGRPT